MELAPLLDALGADGDVSEWSICATESRQLSLGVKDREAGNVHAPLTLSESGGARYLVVRADGRVSRGFFERRQAETDPQAALRSAQAAAYEDPDAAQVLGPAPIPRVELHDRGAAEAARGRTEPLAGRLARIRKLVQERGAKTWSGSFSATESTTRILTSAGLDAASESTSIGWFVSLNGEIGDGFSARCAESEDDFGARLERLFDTAERLAGPEATMVGGVRPVLLHPRVVEQYVLGTLLANLSGSTVEHGEGHFGIEQFGSGERLLRPDLALRLDPLRPLRRGSYRFSSAGLPADRCSFIEGGCLVQPCLDLKYARRLGLPPTPLPLAMDVIELTGAPPLELAGALAAGAGGALVLAVLGVHTQDSASGDFSLSAPQALCIGDGGLAGRVRATISGNLFEILADDEVQWVRFPGEHTPGLLFPCRLDPK